MIAGIQPQILPLQCPSLIHVLREPPSRLPIGAVKLAQLCVERSVPIFLDAEKPRPGLLELLSLTTFLHTSQTFPVAHTKVRVSESLMGAYTAACWML